MVNPLSAYSPGGEAYERDMKEAWECGWKEGIEAVRQESIEALMDAMNISEQEARRKLGLEPVPEIAGGIAAPELRLDE